MEKKVEMSTLVSRSDDEIENISPENELVTFDHIRSNRCATHDFRVSYLLGANIVTSSYDWVGLYRTGWSNVNTYVTYQWAPVQNVKTKSNTRRRLVVLPRLSYWQSFKSDERFQILYVASSGHVLGLSQPFGFSEPEQVDLSLSIFQEWTDERDVLSAEESFTCSNAIDILSMDVIALSSSSESSDSSICEVEADDIPENNIVLWDTKTLAVDFSGKSWLEELALLNDPSIVQEYQEHLVSPPPSSPPREHYQPITEIEAVQTCSLVADADGVEEEAVPLLLSTKGRGIVATQGSMAVVPAYTSVATSIKNKLRHGDVPVRQRVEVLKSRKPIPLTFQNQIRGTSNGAKKARRPIPLLQKWNSRIPVRSRLCEANEDKKCVAIYNADNKRKAKRDRINVRMDVIRQLLRTIPESAHLQRPMSCAPDCIGCVASQQLLKMFEGRFLIEKKRNTDLLRTNTEHPGPSVASQTSEDQMSYMSAMLAFVKRTEDTISLLHDALSATLSKTYTQKDTQTALEKLECSELKMSQDATTEYNEDDADVFTNEDPHGWKVKESRRIRRMKWLVSRKNEELQNMHDRDQCHRVQLVMYHDVINDLKRSVRDERRQAQSARQEAVMLKYQVRRLSSKPTIPAWGRTEAPEVGEASTTTTAIVPAKLGDTCKSYRDCTAGLATPFYPNKKAFRQDLNKQIKEGHCRFCGMPISAKVDKRVVEEHITYHLQFHV